MLTIPFFSVLLLYIDSKNIDMQSITWIICKYGLVTGKVFQIMPVLSYQEIKYNDKNKIYDLF